MGIIKRLKRIDKKCYILIRATITKKNYYEVEQIIKLAKKLEIDEVGLRVMVISKGNCIINKSLAISPRKYLKLLRTIPRLQSEYKMRIYSGDPLQNLFDPIFIETTKNKIQNYAGCLVGISYLYLNNGGMFAFCPMLNSLILGDPKKEDISTIWKNNSILNRLRGRCYEKDSSCNDCKFKFLCGGCRARALFKSGKLMGQDPNCTFSILKKINKNFLGGKYE